MADYGNFVSAELQANNEEFTDTLNTPDIITTASILNGLPAAYSRCFHFVGGSSLEGLTWTRDVDNQTPPTTNHIIGSVYIRFSHLTPDTEYRFFGFAPTLIADVFGNLVPDFFLETNGDVRIEDATNATITTINSPFTVDTWNHIEIRMLPASGSGSEMQVWINGIEELGNTTGLELDTHTNMDFLVVGGSPTATEEVYFASGLSIVNSTAATDRITGSDADQEWEVTGPYVNDLGAGDTAPDENGAGTGAGTSLDTAGWGDMAVVPIDTAEGEYSDAGGAKDGSVYTDGAANPAGSGGGPSGDPNIDTDAAIVAAKFISQLRRGNGGGTTHTHYWGNSADAGGSDVVTLSTANALFNAVTEAATEKPLSTEFMRQGFGKSSGGREIFCSVLVSTLLHLPVAITARNALSGATYPDQNYFVGPHEI